MALTANVASGAPITSAWGNEIRDRSVQVFASAAARASGWVAPPEGAVSYLVDSDAVEKWTGAAWVPIAAAGQLAFVASTTDVGITSAAYADVGLTAAVAVGGGRRLKVETSCQFGKAAGTAIGGIVMTVTDAANLDLGNVARAATLNDGETLTLATFVVVTPAAGTFTAKVRAASTVGTTFYQEGALMITDVGAV